jgi:hypothetical protein
MIRFGDALAVDVSRLAAFDVSGLDPSEVEARFTESVTGVRLAQVPAYTAQGVGAVGVRAPHITGNHDLIVTLRAGGAVVAENRYPIHVVAEAAAPYDVQVAGEAGGALRAVGARPGTQGPLVVAEHRLDAEVGAEVRRRLGAGETVLMLAQPPEAAEHYPLPTEVAPVETEWGSSVFHFTTDSGALPSLPRRNMLVAEESTIQARSVIVRMGAGSFPDEPVVIAYKPVPGSITGWVVGAQGVGPGWLVCCQYRLTARAAAGDAAARALLADLVRWAAAPRAGTELRPTVLADGRSLTYYSYPEVG